ncbi:hypothetical protein [Streptomyces iconiensis]|uniref:Uncharacterized protein n=1 Tax=Streptomyces iconiensis TaxID=1384038 RepID=A0ABT6ZTG3_9ACTN|nr:hypothetical protein [Streptomyces iconiensis]MDJ1132084.1 hypothetical protein [Streptomyces iconiensis]
MATDLQQVVDALGARLGRSVAVDDRRLRLLAHSAHHGEADSARIESLMNRGVSTELVEHVAAEGAPCATGLFTISARPEIGIEVARFGMPIRYEGAPLGYVWLTANEGPAGRREADGLREAARQAALILHGEHLHDQVSRSRETRVGPRPRVHRPRAQGRGGPDARRGRARRDGQC